MTPLERIEAKIDRVEAKVDAIRSELGSHTHSGHITWPWYIGTTLTITALLVGLLV